MLTNREIIEKLNSEFNRHNLTGVMALHAPDFTHDDDEGYLPGRAGAEQFYRTYFAAFPDLSCTIDSIVCEGSQVAVRYTVRATHLGEYNGIKPSGKPVTINSLFIYRLQHGLIVESWGVVAELQFLAQLGFVMVQAQEA